jgi:TIM-barrel protein
MISLRNPVILAAMAGICDGKFCFEAARAGAGMVTIGGINFDIPTISAGLKIKARERSEFNVELGNLENFLIQEVTIAKKGNAPVAVNIRAATQKGLLKAAEIVQNSGAEVFELNAHCRQPEITQVGAGEALLFNPEKLIEWIKSLKKILKIPLIVKWRANVVDDVPLAKMLESLGVDAFHIDAMKSGYPLADLETIRRVSMKSKTFLIGNNSVTSVDKALKMLKTGIKY